MAVSWLERDKMTPKCKEVGVDDVELNEEPHLDRAGK